MQTLVNRGVPGEGKVHVGQPRAGKSVARSISKGASDRRNKCIGIKPLRNRLGIEISVKVRIELRARWITCVSITGWVVAKLRREGEAALNRGDATYGPSCDNGLNELIGIAKCSVTMAQRQFPRPIDSGSMRD